jgi:hypothetical protein
MADQAREREPQASTREARAEQGCKQDLKGQRRKLPRAEKKDMSAQPGGAPLLFPSHAGADTEAARRLNQRIETAPAALERGLVIGTEQHHLKSSTFGRTTGPLR